MKNTRFTPNQTFAEGNNSYCKGLNYTARDPNQPGISEAEIAGRTKLAALLPQWIAEGRVRVGEVPHPDMPRSLMSGQGTVS